MSAQFTIGLDYGTNSVRALIVNVANGAEIASAVWNYSHGTAGVILSRDPNLARQHPLDYINGAEITIKAALAAAKKSVKDFRAGTSHRHRRGHDWQHAAARGCQWPAAGVPKEVCEQPRRDGVAVERPHRHRRGRRNYRACKKNPPAISRQVRRHLFERMVFQQDFEMPACRARSVSTPRIHGSSFPTSCPPR